jgi:tetratricopeptide (TPR) repeat protein
MEHRQPARPGMAPPAKVNWLIQRAARLCAAGHIEVALAVLDDAVADDPTPAARIALAVMLAQTQPVRAVAELERAWNHACLASCPRFRALCCGNLCVLHFRLGNTHQAACYRQHALTAQMELVDGDPDAALPVDAFIDLAAHWMTAAEDAIWTECLLNAAAARCPDGGDQAAIASHRGVIAARSGRLDDAIVHWSQAQRQFRDAGDADGAAHTLINLGHLLLQQQRAELARRAFAIGRDLFDEARQPEHAAVAQRFAGEAAALARLADGEPAWN